MVGYVIKNVHLFVRLINIIILPPTNIVEDADVVCEAGVVWNELNDMLQEKGIPLFFPVCFISNLCYSFLIFASSSILGLAQLSEE